MRKIATILIFAMVIPNFAFAKKAKKLYRDPGEQSGYDVECGDGETVTVTLQDLAAQTDDPQVAKEAQALANADAMWNMIERNFYCAAEIKHSGGKYKRFFKMRKMKKAIAQHCKIRRHKLKKAMKPMWKARKKSGDYTVFTRYSANKYNWNSVTNGGACQHDWKDGEKNGVKKSRKRAGAYFRSNAQTSCSSLKTEFAGIVNKARKSKDQTTDIEKAEVGYDSFWARAEALVKDPEGSNPKFCKAIETPKLEPPGGGDFQNHFQSQMANTQALAGIPPEEGKKEEAVSPAGAAESAATAAIKEDGMRSKSGGAGNGLGGKGNGAGKGGPTFTAGETKGGIGSGGGAGILGSASSSSNGLGGAKESEAKAEDVAYESAAHGESAGGKRFGADYGSAGGLGTANFGKGSEGAVGPDGMGLDADKYFEMAGTASLFERVSPHHGKWGDANELLRMKDELRNSTH